MLPIGKRFAAHDFPSHFKTSSAIATSHSVGGKVITVDDQGRTFDLEGNQIKRFGFHVFRHSPCSLMADGENPAVVQATLRHTRLDMTMYYAHSRKKQKPVWRY